MTPKTLEDVIEYFKNNKCPYGINWCENEKIPREPNSLGSCDYCGEKVGLKTLASAIRSWIEGRLPSKKEPLPENDNDLWEDSNNMTCAYNQALSEVRLALGVKG